MLFLYSKKCVSRPQTTENGYHGSLIIRIVTFMYVWVTEWVMFVKNCMMHKGFIFICLKSMFITRTQNQITMPPADLICGNLRMTEMINVFVAFFFIDDFFIIIIKIIIIYAWPLYLWFSISNRILFNKSVVYLYAYIQ